MAPAYLVEGFGSGSKADGDTIKSAAPSRGIGSFAGQKICSFCWPLGSPALDRSDPKNLLRKIKMITSGLGAGRNRHSSDPWPHSSTALPTRKREVPASVELLKSLTGK